MRKTTYENRKARIESGRLIYSYEQVEDVVELVKNKKRPDGNFGDDECLLWELIKTELGCDF